MEKNNARCYNKVVESQKTNLVKLAAILIVLALLGLAFWYYSARKKAPEPIKTAEDVVEAVTQPGLNVPSNPLGGKVPEVNPVDRANPFKDAYRNPFE